MMMLFSWESLLLHCVQVQTTKGDRGQGAVTVHQWSSANWTIGWPLAPKAKKAVTLAAKSEGKLCLSTHCHLTLLGFQTCHHPSCCHPKTILWICPCWSGGSVCVLCECVMCTYIVYVYMVILFCESAPAGVGVVCVCCASVLCARTLCMCILVIWFCESAPAGVGVARAWVCEYVMCLGVCTSDSILQMPLMEWG